MQDVHSIAVGCGGEGRVHLQVREHHLISCRRHNNYQPESDCDLRNGGDLEPGGDRKIFIVTAYILQQRSQ